MLGLAADQPAERDEESARRRGAGKRRFDERRIRRSRGKRLATRIGAFFGRLRMFARRLRFGGKRGDAAIEARRGRIKIALAFANVVIEQSHAAKQHRREKQRPPDVKRERERPQNDQRGDDIADQPAVVDDPVRRKVERRADFCSQSVTAGACSWVRPNASANSTIAARSRRRWLR